MKKTLFIALVMLMLLCMLPITGSAAESVTLDLKNGEIVITKTGYSQGDNVVDDYTGDYVVKYTGGGANRLTIKDRANARVVLDNVHMSVTRSSILVQSGATATLILRGENSVIFSDPTKVGSAIAVNCDSHVIIDSETGNDKLTVKGGAYGAGIGSVHDDYNDTAQITINSGIIVAETGNEGAGIGGGRYSSAHVVINGGNITARSVRNAAAIGTGREGVGGSVTINGGVVYADASGGINSAGIGGGFRGYLDFVNITGGVVTAVSAHANIGGIDWGVDVDKTANPVNLYISGGSVKSLRKGSADNEALTAKVSASDNTPALLTIVEMPQDALGSTLFVGDKFYRLLGSHPEDTKYYLYLPATATTMSCQSAGAGFEASAAGGTPVTANDWVRPDEVSIYVKITGDELIVTKGAETVADNDVLSVDYNAALDLVFSKKVIVKINGEEVLPVQDGENWKLSIGNALSSIIIEISEIPAEPAGPNEPEEPGEPGEPEEPNEPADPNEPGESGEGGGSAGPTKPAAPSKADDVKTGDIANTSGACLMLATVAIAGGGLIATKKRKK